MKIHRMQIKKQGVLTNEGHFKTQEEAEAWLKQEQANKSFGDYGTYSVHKTVTTQNKIHLENWNHLKVIERIQKSYKA